MCPEGPIDKGLKTQKKSEPEGTRATRHEVAKPQNARRRGKVSAPSLTTPWSALRCSPRERCSFAGSFADKLAVPQAVPAEEGWRGDAGVRQTHCRDAGRTGASL